MRNLNQSYLAEEDRSLSAVENSACLQGMADKNKHPFSFHISRVLSRFMFFPKSVMSEPFKMVNWMIVGQEMDQVA